MLIDYARTQVEVKFSDKGIKGTFEEIKKLIFQYNFVVQYLERQADRTPVERRNREIRKELLENHNVLNFHTTTKK